MMAERTSRGVRERLLADSVLCGGVGGCGGCGDGGGGGVVVVVVKVSFQRDERRCWRMWLR